MVARYAALVALSIALFGNVVTCLPSSLVDHVHYSKHGVDRWSYQRVGRSLDLKSSQTPSSSHPSFDSMQSLKPVPASWYHNQTLDHFDGTDTRTWSQRYFVNDTFWDPVEGPVFLCVGGEGPPLTGYSVVASVHCNDAVELAPKVNALLIAVEHRYYGESTPTPDFTTANLKWLSAHQALADLAQFHTYAVQEFSMTPKNQWVSFGGSYPGMLSGWFRLKFPHLVVASVSNSSPVRAQFNFEGYLDVVAQSTAAPIVGGSTECLDAVVAGHSTVGDMLKTDDGRTSLAKMFNICGGPDVLADPDNQADWAGNGVISLPAQENDPSCTQPGCNISGVCSVMTDETVGSPLDRLSKVAAIQFGSECMYLNHTENMVEPLLNTTLAGGVARIWFYQTCTEFAYYQTCEVGSMCPFTQGVNVITSFTDLCKIAFDIDPSTTQNNVNLSNDYWGADDPQGQRIMFPNGQIDPWHYLGVLKQPDPTEPTLWVPGASHHFWTHPSKPTDGPHIIEAREAIWKQVTTWLEETKPN